ncbi:UDP-2,4-diacetamido-2,4,6-trideoxy-beta-L-altropyranose hydrolase [Romboutsia maritimum]|uniref:UDP-2,4-diacetamido-2,4, 6-trideoxy-beta-L-altropyranose hydrolase n=1 Tax=Romboutsia maritimum TaxID=2020948 RepID=A0A371IS56_9FIRM|nr:UDP-2,4-diacetamido-2,4,6-trideoxy-beta-L-altropyranose hydrolase [Romboutsia maritimum]RDY23316.1 UDP-2,4-diacetamido-2,4,6-trideoxy-beta-L-altropyranose hydrolase [Romboutsia maritimum]
MKYIGIRADGDCNKGMGHIVRCTSIAKEFNARGIKPIFITKQNESVSDLLSSHNLQYINIKSIDIKDEIKEIEKILKGLKINCILTDSYWLSNEYLERLKMISKILISIDDNSLYEYPSDIVINANIHAKDLNYKLKNKSCVTLLGTKYSILRKEFQDINPIEIKPNVDRILVSMGGVDVNNFTPIALESLSKLKYNIIIDVVVSNVFKYKENLINIAKKNNNINLIFNPINMKEVMEKCDLAISASGTTIYELGVLGVPTILIPQVDNQVNIAKKANDLGMMINLGKYNEIDLSKINKAVIRLINNIDIRAKMSKISSSSIDSNGVINIVDEIIKYQHSLEDKYENR